MAEEGKHLQRVAECRVCVALGLQKSVRSAVLCPEKKLHRAHEKDTPLIKFKESLTFLNLVLPFCSFFHFS